MLNEHTSDIETWKEAQLAARLDYELHLGCELTVSYVSAYVDDDSVDIEGPFRVRITPTCAADLTHENGEYLDPYWDVEVLDEGFEGSSPWIHGPSYRVLEAAWWRLAS